MKYCRFCDAFPCMCGKKDYGTEKENSKKNKQDFWEQRGEYIGKNCSTYPSDKNQDINQ